MYALRRRIRIRCPPEEMRFNYLFTNSSSNEVIHIPFIIIIIINHSASSRWFLCVPRTACRSSSRCSPCSSASRSRAGARSCARHSPRLSSLFQTWLLIAEYYRATSHACENGHALHAGTSSSTCPACSSCGPTSCSSSSSAPSSCSTSCSASSAGMPSASPSLSPHSLISALLSLSFPCSVYWNKLTRCYVNHRL